MYIVICIVLAIVSLIASIISFRSKPWTLMSRLLPLFGLVFGFFTVQAITQILK